MIMQIDTSAPPQHLFIQPQRAYVRASVVLVCSLSTSRIKPLSTSTRQSHQDFLLDREISSFRVIEAKFGARNRPCVCFFWYCGLIGSVLYRLHRQYVSTQSVVES